MARPRRALTQPTASRHGAAGYDHQMKHARRLAAILLAIAIAVLPGRAAADEERITSYAIDIEVQPSGELLVREEIAYDFGSTPRHGIFRDIVTKQRYDDTYDRSYPLAVVSVAAAPSDTPAGYVVEDAGAGITRVRIGDADRTITGLHTYRITYRISGTLNGFSDHDELYWNVIGADWAVPIERATVTVSAPAAPTAVTCFAGPTGSSEPCGRAVIEGGRATFAQPAGLDTYEGLTIVVSLPSGTVSTPVPILNERQTFARAFTVDPLRIALMLVLLAGVVGGVARLLWVTGRDRQWRGQPVAAIPAGPDEVEDRIPLFGGTAIPVEYTPPEAMRPGLVGTVFDEVAHPLDISATIVDLAVRGYLRIEEIEGKGWFASDDWKLSRLKPGDGLAPYEQMLFSGLFRDGEEVKFSDLREHFASRLQQVQTLLYRDLVHRQWYRGSPQDTRTRWLTIAIAAWVAATGIEVVAGLFTSFAIVPLPLLLGAMTLLALHGRMPARTASGTAVYRRVLGFRRFILDAETYRARFAEQAGLYYEYLPYAIVFGATKQWARAFEGLALPAPDWYVSSQPFSALMLANAMTGFSDRSTGALTSTPGSSGGSGFSGGSSGGGGGGGGGGSW